jgi:hypothetical protein
MLPQTIDNERRGLLTLFEFGQMGDWMLMKII